MNLNLLSLIWALLFKCNSEWLSKMDIIHKLGTECKSHPCKPCSGPCPFASRRKVVIGQQVTFSLILYVKSFSLGRTKVFILIGYRHEWRLDRLNSVWPERISGQKTNPQLIRKNAYSWQNAKKVKIQNTSCHYLDQNYVAYFVQPLKCLYRKT